MNNPKSPIRAFPGPGQEKTLHLGMTLRDYFAGQALAGFMADPAFSIEQSDAIAGLAYHLADAMLTKRGA